MLLAVRYAEEALEYAWAAAKELPFRKPFLRLTSCGPSDTARRKTLGSDPPRPHWTKTTPHRYQRCESHIPPSYFFFLLSAAIGKAQPRERSAREGPPAELTSPSIELPFASRVVTRVGSAHGSWVFQGFRGMVLSKEQNGIPRGGRRHLQQSTCWGGHPPRSPLPPRLQTVAEAKRVRVSSRSSRLRIAA